MPKYMMMAAGLLILMSPAFAQELVEDNVLVEGDTRAVIESEVLVDENTEVILTDDEAPEKPVAIIVEKSAWEDMQKMGSISKFNDALLSTDLYRLLETGEPYTIFAPTNSAFSGMNLAKKRRLQDPEKIGLLRKTIAYHIAPGHYMADDLKNGQFVSTLEGAKIKIRAGANNIYAEEGKLTRKDVQLDHLIIHVIDEVLTEAR